MLVAKLMLVCSGKANVNSFDSFYAMFVWNRSLLVGPSAALARKQEAPQHLDSVSEQLAVCELYSTVACKALCKLRAFCTVALGRGRAGAL